jgi:hypothetical protein
VNGTITVPRAKPDNCIAITVIWAQGYLMNVNHFPVQIAEVN